MSGTIRDQLASALTRVAGCFAPDYPADLIDPEEWDHGFELADAALRVLGDLDPDADGELVAAHLAGDRQKIEEQRDEIERLTTELRTVRMCYECSLGLSHEGRHQESNAVANAKLRQELRGTDGK